MTADSNNLSTKLATFLQESPSDASFPTQSINYFDRFVNLDRHLNTEIHPYANQGATAREPIWLTDHGPEHIATVIRRASDLVCQNKCFLTPYEAYILLLACHFHDVGNVFGRIEHERKAREILFGLETALIGGDAFEKRIICDIAMAHGGFVDDVAFDKDTIGKLRYDPPTSTLGVRVKMLAAILRFADELADDRTRTSRFVMDAVRRVHPGSEIYHIYADRLRPIEIDPAARNISVHFELSTSLVAVRHQKNSGAAYIIDEILVRTLKMHHEHVYCGRFMLPHVLFDQITVLIELCTDDYSQVLGQIRYAMAQQGYPTSPAELQEICPALSCLNGEALRAQAMALNASGTTGSPYESPPDLLAVLARKRGFWKRLFNC